MVCGFKIGVTKWTLQNADVQNVWQRNYYEHIIHDEQSWICKSAGRFTTREILSGALLIGFLELIFILLNVLPVATCIFGCSPMKSILIADDHSLIRSGLRMVLDTMAIKADISEAWNAATVMERMKEKSFDLILLDIQMPATDPVVLMHWIRNFHPGTKILIVSQNPENIYGKRYLQLGADGFINKTVPDDEMIKAINKVLNGNKYISEELSETILHNMLDGKKANPFDQLSQREFQVAICLAKGYTLNETCDMLQLQYSTAHTHKRRAFEKLNVEDNKGLTQLAGAYDLLG